MPKYYNNTCEYIFKNGYKKGQQCGNNCQEKLCKTHKKSTLDKKKEYYNNNKIVNNDAYYYLIERAKKHIKNHNNVNREYYEHKQLNLELELINLNLKKNGILLALNKITENEIILKSKKMMILLIKMFKHYEKNYKKEKNKEQEIKKQQLLDKLDILERRIGHSKNMLEKFKDFNLTVEYEAECLNHVLSEIKIEKLKESKEFKELEKSDIEKLMSITLDEFNNEELRIKSLEKYNETEKYFNYKHKLTDDDRDHFNKIIEKPLYLPFDKKKAKNEDLKNIEDDILHTEKLILTYNEIIKLFD
jgi:hypothetical protein